MAQSIADLIQALSADPWRDRQGFTQDIEFYNLQILGESKSDEEISISLREWLEELEAALLRIAVNPPEHLLGQFIGP